MNYLELCQKLVRRAGISGAIVTAQNQTGEMLRVVSDIDEAYRYLLNKHDDWEFLRADVQIETINAVREYTAAAAGVAQFGEWRFTMPWTCYDAEIGPYDEQDLEYMAYDDFKRRYLFGSSRMEVGRPQIVTEKPDQTLAFWPIPDRAYIIGGEQFRNPPDLAKDADEPVFAARFHDAVVYRALMLYGQFEGDATVFATGQTELARVLAAMERFYLPSMTTGETMA